MRINFTIKSGHVKARLSDGLDITTVASDRDHLAQILHGGDSCEINLGGITEFDTAGLQLLLAFEKEAQGLGKRRELVEPSSSVLEVATLLGIEERFRTRITLS